jgi:hypothetical protein
MESIVTTRSDESGRPVMGLPFLVWLVVGAGRDASSGRNRRAPVFPNRSPGACCPITRTLAQRPCQRPKRWSLFVTGVQQSAVCRDAGNIMETFDDTVESDMCP